MTLSVKIISSFFLSSTFLLSSCLNNNNAGNYLLTMKMLDKSLMISNATLDKTNRVIYKSLEDKLISPETAQQAIVWQPKAALLYKLADDLIVYIDDLKDLVKKQAGLRLIEKDGMMVEDFHLDNMGTSARVFEEQGKGVELEQKLLHFKQNVLAIDPEIQKVFERNLPIETGTFLNDNDKEEEFTPALFHKIPAITALTLLSKFQNNVKNTENMVVTYCHNKIGMVDGCGLVRNRISFIVSQNKSFVKAGEKIIIQAGIGEFYNAAKPEIMIAGKNIPLSLGLARYTLATSSKTGVHKVPVKITYTDENGQQQSREKIIEYEVASPCN